MNRFNLTFWGEILPGKDPQQVKARFAKLFDIKDPERLEHFFSGDTIILRRNLDRKVAGEYYHKLHKLGVEAQLVKVDPLADDKPDPVDPPSDPPTVQKNEDQWEEARRQAEAERLQRSDLEHKKKQRAAEFSRQRQEEQKAREAALRQAREAIEEKAQQEREEKEQAAARKSAEAEQEERKRKAEEARQREAEEAVRQKAEAEQRIAEEEARKKTAEEEAARKEAERLRKAEEDAERKAAAEAERKREAEEEAKRKAAAEAERKRKAEEAAARKAAAEAERKRKAEEEAKRKAAAEAERKRKAEEAAARKAAAEAERKRKADEAAKRKAAAEAERKRKAEEAAAQKAAAEAERKRKAEEAAKRKAAAEAERKRKAEEAARKKAAEEEVRRKQVEAAALKKAQEEEEKRKQAEERARIKAEREKERKLREAEAAKIAAQKAEEERRKAEEQRKKAKEAARLEAERAAAEKRRKDALAKKKAEEEARKRKEREDARRKAREAELEAKARAEEILRQELAETQARALELEEKAIERGAKALSGTPTLKATQARVKSKLEIPRHGTAYHADAGKGQRGAPNLYRLQPFRNNSEVRERPALALGKMRKGLLAGTLALAIFLLLLATFIGQIPQQPVSGPSAVAASNEGELVMLAADKLLVHDRAGVPRESITAEQLGLKNIRPPLTYTDRSELLLMASANNENGAQAVLWRCDLKAMECAAAALPDSLQSLDELRVHTLSGDLFIADAKAAQLLKVDSRGELAASRERTLPERPVIQIDSGLLFINSTEGPAISVMRYENQAFGQQLDEVLLLPPPALEKEQTRVWDFASNGDFWWVTLYNPDNGDSGLYLFDRNWKFLRQLLRDEFPHRGQLVNWGNKLLLFSPLQSKLLRYSEAGGKEVNLESPMLQELVSRRDGQRRLVELAWHSALLLALAISLTGFAFAYLHKLRALVYKNRKTRGAEPLDELANDIQWIGAAPGRTQQLRHATIASGVLAVAALITLIGLGVSMVQLLAAMIALSGPVIALQLLSRSETEHLGSWNDALALVDHRHLYHLARGARIQYRGRFVMIDDIVIFTGAPLLPALDAKQLEYEASELIRAGVKVDRKTLLVKLLESGHPTALALQTMLIALSAGIGLLILELLLA